MNLDPRRDKVLGGLYAIPVFSVVSVYLMMALRTAMRRTCTAYPMDAHWNAFRVMELGFVLGSTCLLCSAWYGLRAWLRKRKKKDEA